jgi:hypothetical protein
MSRVHDALRRAEQSGAISGPVARPNVAGAAVLDQGPDVHGLLEQVQEVPFRVATDSLLIDVTRPMRRPWRSSACCARGSIT